MKKPLLILSAIILLSTSVQAEELVYSTSKILLAYVGADIVMEAHERIGLKLTVKHYPAKRALELSNEGITDGEIGRIRTINEQYPNLVRVEPPIYSHESYIFTKDIEFRVDGWSSLKPYRIGIHRGHQYAVDGTAGMNVKQIDSDKQLLKMVDMGRLDVAVVNLLDAQKIIRDENLQGKLKMLEPAISVLPLYLYLHKSKAHLIPKISKSLQEMVDSGRLKEITQESLAKHSSK